jgi:hypothetical protein
MKHFLARLVDRVRENTPRVEPIIASRFASGSFPGMAAEIETSESKQEQMVSARKVSRESPFISAVEAEPRGTGTPGERDANIEADAPLVPQSLQQGRVADSGREPAQPHPFRTNQAILEALPLPTRPTGRRGSPVPESTEKEPPIVRVSIGRIEVRAAPLPAPPARRPTRNAKPALTLDAYLKARKEGAR